jgi:hypothetical protein
MGKNAKPRSMDRRPVLTLKLLSAEGVLFAVKDKPIKNIRDIEELLELIKHKI